MFRIICPRACISALGYYNILFPARHFEKMYSLNIELVYIRWMVESKSLVNLPLLELVFGDLRL